MTAIIHMPDATAAAANIARPDGPPHEWDRAAVDALSAIAGPQFAAADAMWESHAPRAFRTMLGPVPGDYVTSEDRWFTFDPQTQSYYAPHSRRVPAAAARAVLTAFLASVQYDLERRAARMAAGITPLAAWQDRMAADVRSLYIAAAAFGAGGFARLTAWDLERTRGDMPAWAGAGSAELAMSAAGVIGGIRTAIARLGRFAAQLAGRAVAPIAGAVVGAVSSDEGGDEGGNPIRVPEPATDAQRMTIKAVAARAGSYVPPARGTAEQASQAAHARAGFDVERSVLGPAEGHCHNTRQSEGCVECAEAGFVPIGTLPAPGLRTCGPGCQCHMEYGRRVSPGVVAMSAGGDPAAMELGGWRMSAAGAGYHRTFAADAAEVGPDSPPPWGDGDGLALSMGDDPDVQELGYFRMVEDKDGEGYHRAYFDGDDPKGGKPANPPWLNPKVVGKKKAAENQKAHVAKHGKLPEGTEQHPPAKRHGHIAITPKAKAKLDKHGVKPEQLIEHAEEADSHHIGSSKGKHGEGTTLHVTGVKDGKVLYAKAVGPGHKVWHGNANEGGVKAAPETDENPVTASPAAEKPKGDPIHPKTEDESKSPAFTVSNAVAEHLNKVGVTPEQIANKIAPAGSNPSSGHVQDALDPEKLYVHGKTDAGEIYDGYVNKSDPLGIKADKASDYEEDFNAPNPQEDKGTAFDQDEAPVYTASDTLHEHLNAIGATPEQIVKKVAPAGEPISFGHVMSGGEPGELYVHGKLESGKQFHGTVSKSDPLGSGVKTPEKVPHGANPDLDALLEDGPNAPASPPHSASSFHVLADPGTSGDGHDAHGQWGKYGAAGVLIKHKGEDGVERYLLVQRGPAVSSNKGKWQLPGGALDSKENAYQGTARELTEELAPPDGFLDGLKPVGETIHAGKGDWKYTNIAAESPNQFTPKVDGTETGDAKWFTKDQIDQLPLHPALKDKMDELMGHFGGPSVNAEPKNSEPAKSDRLNVSVLGSAKPVLDGFGLTGDQVAEHAIPDGVEPEGGNVTIAASGPHKLHVAYLDKNGAYASHEVDPAEVVGGKPETAAAPIAGGGKGSAPHVKMDADPALSKKATAKIEGFGVSPQALVDHAFKTGGEAKHITVSLAKDDVGNTIGVQVGGYHEGDQKTVTVTDDELKKIGGSGSAEPPDAATKSPNHVPLDAIKPIGVGVMDKLKAAGFTAEQVANHLVPPGENFNKVYVGFDKAGEPFATTIDSAHNAKTYNTTDAELKAKIAGSPASVTDAAASPSVTGKVNATTAAQAKLDELGITPEQLADHAAKISGGTINDPIVGQHYGKSGGLDGLSVSHYEGSNYKSVPITEDQLNALAGKPKATEAPSVTAAAQSLLDSIGVGVPEISELASKQGKVLKSVDANEHGGFKMVTAPAGGGTDDTHWIAKEKVKEHADKFKVAKAAAGKPVKVSPKAKTALAAHGIDSDDLIKAMTPNGHTPTHLGISYKAGVPDKLNLKTLTATGNEGEANWGFGAAKNQHGKAVGTGGTGGDSAAAATAPNHVPESAITMPFGDSALKAEGLTALQVANQLVPPGEPFKKVYVGVVDGKPYATTSDGNGNGHSHTKTFAELKSQIASGKPPAPAAGNPGWSPIDKDHITADMVHVSPNHSSILGAIGVSPVKVANKLIPPGQGVKSVHISVPSDGPFQGKVVATGFKANGESVGPFGASASQIANDQPVPADQVASADHTGASLKPAAITPHAPKSTLPAGGVNAYGDAKADLAEHGLTPEQVVDHFAPAGSKLTYASVKTYPQAGGNPPKASVSWTPEGGMKGHVSQADISGLPKSIAPVPKPKYVPPSYGSTSVAKTPVQLKVHADPVAASAEHVKAQVAAAAASRPAGFPAAAHDLSVVKKLGGSTGAELVQDSAGTKFVRKAGANPAHLVNEYHAEQAYRAAGVAVPESGLYEGPNGPLKLSRYVEGTEYGKLTGEAKAAASAELAKGFAADALMGNYDVLGAGGDNVLVGKDGKAWRIDVGGTMAHRAQGLQMKTGDQWNAHPTELWSMRQKGLGQMADVMSGRSWSDIANQAGDLAERRDAILKSVPEADRAVMAGRLDAMGKVAKTTGTLVGDKFKDGYADTFCKHQVGLAKAGVTGGLPKSLMAKPGESRTTLYDENGKQWDDLRGDGSKSAMLHAYVQSAGGDYEQIKDWSEAQAGTSWSSHSLAIKKWLTDKRDVGQGNYLWSKSASKPTDMASASKAAGSMIDDKTDATFSALHAFTHALLSEVNLKNVDHEKGTVKLFRTEDSAVTGMHGLNPGEAMDLHRGALESYSAYKPVSVYGNNMTVQEMPIHRVLGTYLINKIKPHGESNFFAGDHENEFVAMSEGTDAHYVGKHADSPEYKTAEEQPGKAKASSFDVIGKFKKATSKIAHLFK